MDVNMSDGDLRILDDHCEACNNTGTSYLSNGVYGPCFMCWSDSINRPSFKHLHNPTFYV